MAYRWHVVINTPTAEEDMIIGYTSKSCDEDFIELNKIKFIRACKHTHQARPHWHVYVEFRIRKGLADVKRVIGLNKGHCEPCIEDRESNLRYIFGQEEVDNLHHEK